MAEDTKLFRIEQSALEYLTSREVRVAADNLLNAGTEEIPHGMRWDDVPRFYSALRAAALIKVEYAITLERFWHGVWGNVLSSPWKQMTPDDQNEFDEDAGNSVEMCFDEQKFIRCFTSGSPKYVLYASVGIAEGGFSIGFALFKGRLIGHLVKELEGFNFSKSDGLWTESAKHPITEELDLTEMRELARTAVKAASQRLP